MLFPRTALMGCVRPAEVLFVGMNQRYPSFIQTTYRSLPLCLWMKYTSQVIHIHACLQTTATCSDRNQHSHLPSEDTTIFQSLSFFSFLPDAIDQMKEELKENIFPILLLSENAFVGFPENFTETFTFV